TMHYVGIDLHKKTISLCVVDQERKVVSRKTLACAEPAKVLAFFQQLGPFQAVVEATASYEWLWELLEPLAERLVLAHPKKLRVVAESTRKSDRLDAQVLAEFLALDMIPQAYRPTARQRQHRILVRQRWHLRKRITSVKNKIRRILNNYNADRKDLFGDEGLVYLAEVPVSAADRFVLNQLTRLWHEVERQRQAVEKKLQTFARKAPVAEAEGRAALVTIPGIGPVTAEIVLSEVADIQRFRSA